MSLLEKMGNSQPHNNPSPLLIMEQLLTMNPQINNTFNMIKQMTGGNPNKAREIVLEKFKSGNITKEQFEQFKNTAKKIGVDDKVLSELEGYVK